MSNALNTGDDVLSRRKLVPDIFSSISTASPSAAVTYRLPLSPPPNDARNAVPAGRRPVPSILSAPASTRSPLAEAALLPNPTASPAAAAMPIINAKTISFLAKSLALTVYCNDELKWLPHIVIYLLRKTIS